MLETTVPDAAQAVLARLRLRRPVSAAEATELRRQVREIDRALGAMMRRADEGQAG